MDPLYTVILNWNLPDDTLRCVESVRVALPHGGQILVVDNGSDDDSLSRFHDWLDPSVRIVANPHNLGFSGGMNTGIRAALEAGAASVLLLNNDTVIDPEMISHLLEAASSSPRVGIVGPAIYTLDRPGKLWRFADRELPWFPATVRMPERALRRTRGAPFCVEYVTACAMWVRRDLLEKVGLLDEAYFMYFEDADLCRRARDAGYEVWCAPRARLWHAVARSARRVRPTVRYTEAWGRAHFFRTHPHGPWPGLTLAYLAGRTLRLTARDLVRREPHLIAPAWRGLADGWAGRPSSVT